MYRCMILFEASVNSELCGAKQWLTHGPNLKDDQNILVEPDVGSEKSNRGMLVEPNQLVDLFGAAEKYSRRADLCCRSV